MHSSVAYDKSKKEVIQFEVAQQPAFRQADVIRISSVVWSSGTVGRWACVVGEKTNLLVSFGSEVACVGLQVCLFFVRGVSIVSWGRSYENGGARFVNGGAININGGANFENGGAINTNGGGNYVRGGARM